MSSWVIICPFLQIQSLSGGHGIEASTPHHSWAMWPYSTCKAHLETCNLYNSKPQCKCCIPWRRPFLGHFITLELKRGPVSRDHWILEYLIDGECRDHHPTLLYTRALRVRWPLTSKNFLWWEMATPFHFTKAWGGSTWPRLVWMDEKTTCNPTCHDVDNVPWSTYVKSTSKRWCMV